MDTYQHLTVRKSDMFKEEETGEELEAILKNLPKVKNLGNDIHLYYYQGFWVPDFLISGIVSSQRNFVAHDDDIILTSCPKSGTTWLKALVFSIVNRNHFVLIDSPLLKANPHELVPLLDSISPNIIEAMPRPRLLNTHMIYEALPPSIKTSRCKIVDISRNPMDQFISLWHFQPKAFGDNTPPHHLEEAFERFCRGIHAYGPFWDHVLGFWKASLERPHKILFLKYEELKKDTAYNIKRLAEFLGFPFSEEEEKQRIIEEIISLCSLGKLKNLDVNKSGKEQHGISKPSFFRKGEVGDSKNFLTPSMVERMEKLMKEKFDKHNLTFELLL